MLALAVKASGETEVLEWNTNGGYEQLMSLIHEAVGQDWLDQFKFVEQVPGVERATYMVWCADMAQDVDNPWATFHYGLKVGGTVVLTRLYGPETVGLSWEEINFFTAEAEAEAAAKAGV